MIWNWIKKHKIGIILSIGAIFLILNGSIPSCTTSRLKEKILAMEEQIKISNADIEIKMNEIKALEESNKKILADNIQLKKQSEELNKTIVIGLGEIEKLKKERPPIPENCKPIAEAMQREIDVWSKNFSLMKQDRDIWKTSSEQYAKAYDNEHQISLKKDEIIADKDKIILSQEEVIKAQSHQIKLQGLWNGIYKYGGGVLLIILIISLVSK